MFLLAINDAGQVVGQLLPDCNSCFHHLAPNGMGMRDLGAIDAYDINSAAGQLGRSLLPRL